MKILNFGSLNIDYVYNVDHMVERGETLLSTGRNIYAGGKGLNQSIALARAGAEVYHAGSIGTEGEFMKELLAESGVDVSRIKILEDTPSGHTIIQNDKDGDNCIILFGGANQTISLEQIDSVLSDFDEGDFLIVQNEINNLKYLIDRAHERKMTIVLNPSPMNDKIRELNLSYVDYLFVNEIEAAQIIGVEFKDEEEIIRSLKATFPEMHIVLTLGEKGSVYIYHGEIIRQGIYETKTIDTTAAGDTFSGYFVSEILRGGGAKEALDLAAKASSIAVSRAGAAPSIPKLDELMDNKL